MSPHLLTCEAIEANCPGRGGIACDVVGRGKHTSTIRHRKREARTKQPVERFAATRNGCIIDKLLSSSPRRQPMGLARALHDRSLWIGVLAKARLRRAAW